MTAVDNTKSFSGFGRFMAQKQQRYELLIMVAVIAAIGIIFHLLYPIPFTFPDSGAYVLSAAEDVFNVYRPMGYSSYMSFVHFFGSSAAFLFAFSYALHGVAMLFMLFSAKYLLGITSNIIFRIAAACAIFAPRLIFSTNFLMSDSIFATLTMLFVATAMWIIFSRNPFLFIAHLLCLAALFKVRYSGMFYVPVSVVAIYLSFSGATLAKRAISLTPILLFLILFITTKKEYRNQTGVDTFSAFSGWQLINNAAVLLPDAKSIPTYKFEPEQIVFHEFIKGSHDSLFKTEYAMSTHNMWGNDMPYKQFMSYYSHVNRLPYATGWVGVGKMYGDYAATVIKHYPGKYFTRFIIPSLASNFKCWDFSEERGEFRNEPLYRDYFGIEEESYRHEHRIFSNLYPLRRVLNYIYWIGLGLGIILFAMTTNKKNLRDKQWQGTAMVLLFILIHIATATISSPNTTWRYTMPFFVPSLVFMAWAAQKLVVLFISHKDR